MYVDLYVWHVLNNGKIKQCDGIFSGAYCKEGISVAYHVRAASIFSAQIYAKNIIEKLMK